MIGQDVGHDQGKITGDLIRLVVFGNEEDAPV